MLSAVELNATCASGSGAVLPMLEAHRRHHPDQPPKLLSLAQLSRTISRITEFEKQGAVPGTILTPAPGDTGGGGLAAQDGNAAGHGRLGDYQLPISAADCRCWLQSLLAYD